MGTVPCVSCRRECNPPKGWTGPVECGRCWFARTGDYPGSTIPKSKPPSWFTDIDAPSKRDTSRPLAAIGFEGPQ